MAKTPYDRFLDARIQRSKNDNPDTLQHQKANGEVWSSILDAVRLHRINGTKLPQEIAFLLESELSYWVSGIPSPELTLLTRRGRRISPAVRGCQLIAVMYLVASQELASDHRFRQTVLENFKISKSTLQNWKNKFYGEACSAFADFRKDMDREDRISGMKVLMVSSAKQYRSLIKRQKPKRRS